MLLDAAGPLRAMLVGDDLPYLEEFASIVGDLGAEVVGCLGYASGQPAGWPAHDVALLDLQQVPEPAVALGLSLQRAGTPAIVTAGALQRFLAEAERRRFRPQAAFEKPYSVPLLRAALWQAAGRAGRAVRR
ncbi:MAG: hypothetical protein U1E53_15345 [Dongiaceae bacterium]